jgi:hypothetical protein
MNKLILCLGIAGALIGCGGGNGFDGILKQGKAFKDATCACKDQACIDKVEKDMDVWMEKAAKSFKGKPTKAQDEAWDKVEDESRACRAKVKDAADLAAVGAVVAKLIRLKEQCAACTDLACGTDKIAPGFAALDKDVSALSSDVAGMDKVTALTNDISGCLEKLLTPPTPPVDPTAAPTVPATP